MISIETARELLDFEGGTATHTARISADRAEEQLQGAVALHNILKTRNVAYLADEVGLGKTYVALGAFALFRHFNPRFRLLVIAPKENIQRKWIKELDNFVRNNVRFADLRVRSIHGRPAHPAVYCSNLYDLARETTLDPDRDFFARLTSFGFGLSEDNTEGWVKRRDKLLELLPWLPTDLFDLRSKTAFKENYARAISCALPRFDLVIIDEGHNLKHGLHKKAALRNRLLAMTLGHDPDRDRMLLKRLPHYGPRAERVLFLSATPLEDDYRHIWNQLDVVGMGEAAPLLADKYASEDAKREAVGQFLIRRVSRIRSSTQELTKNLYRREWAGGGVASHDEPLPDPSDRQRLLVALVQKKVSELLDSERFNHSFQIGMLASFESFLQTTKTRNQELPTFDDSDQTDNDLEREGLDVHAVNGLTRSYERRFGQPMPHPKMDSLVDTLKSSFDSGQKALVFVRRVASVRELEEKLEAEYDLWLERRLRDELPEHAHRIAALFTRYREERRNRQLRKAGAASADGVAVTTDPDTSDLEAEDIRDRDDDTGGNDTFFAWFFRGEGPDGVLSGAELSKRFQLPQFALSSFFEDNYAAALLEVRPGGVLKALSNYLQQAERDVQAELETRAGRYVRSEQKRKRHRHLFLAFQAAAMSILEEDRGPLSAEAALVMQEIIDERHEDGPPVPLGNWLERSTFFTALRAREDLSEALWQPPHERTLKLEQRFRRRELRRELIASMFRLGHSLIDLYVAVIQMRGTLDRASEGEDLDNEKLASAILDLLGQQREGKKFRAFHELAQAASHFDLILDVNAHHLWERDFAEVSREIGKLLRAQQPIGGMFGEVSKTLVTQFRMPGYPFVLVTTDLLQEGEDLHLFCSHVYHYGISWMPSSMEQRIGRIDRVRSHTERRLTGLAEEPSGDHLLQVYFPYLRETVEVFQVNRVLDRMDRFMRLMHENLGTPEDDADRRIHLLDEVGRSISRRQAAPKVPLKSSFPVRDSMLNGKQRSLAVSHQIHDDLLSRFDLLQTQLMKMHGVSWQRRGPVNGRIGRIPVGRREQSFTIFLHSTHGHPLIRCVSPIGSIEPEANVEAIVAAARLLRANVAAVYDPRFRDYKLTAESDVLLGAMEHDIERVWHLITRTTTAADRLEETLLQLDAAAGKYRDGLEQEPTFER